MHRSLFSGFFGRGEVKKTGVKEGFTDTVLNIVRNLDKEEGNWAGR